MGWTLFEVIWRDSLLDISLHLLRGTPRSWTKVISRANDGRRSHIRIYKGVVVNDRLVKVGPNVSNVVFLRECVRPVSAKSIERVVFHCTEGTVSPYASLNKMAIGISPRRW
jgi:hypothetical protein